MVKRDAGSRLRAAVGAGLAALVALTLPGAASANALYDQTTGTPGGLVTMPQSGIFPSPLADDLTVPPGPGWLIENAHIEGQGGAGDQFGVAIVQDSAGLPDPAGALVRLGYTAKQGGSGSFDVTATKKYKYVTDLPYGIGLLPGHYWIESFQQVSTPGVSGSPWAWRTQSPQSGSEAAIYDDASSSWRHLSDAGQSGPDFQFRVDGEPISSDASRFKLSKPVRRPGGAVVVLANFPGNGTPQVKLTSGKKWVKPLKLHSNVFGTKLKFNPTAKGKRKFRDGRHLKFSASITYARSFGELDSPQPFVAPPTTQKLHSVFKKPKPQGQ